ncbi:hypothetical protein Syun_000191 [Stephania yunnanensis]|uniref:Uncharacterized protein n=1 Tax=Stephania yunnanensis TaxID=152371 RepID=A0AAP0LBP1_9MAGN
MKRISFQWSETGIKNKLINGVDLSIGLSVSSLLSGLLEWLFGFSSEGLTRSVLRDSVPFLLQFHRRWPLEDLPQRLVDIVDLRLVPFGNAEIGSDNKTITCQISTHGPGECFLNTLEACAINAWPDLNTHFAFIYCIEHLVAEGKVKQWQSCFEKTGLDSAPIANCYKSGLGTKLELQYGNETKSLVPPHEYVPWVVVNNKPLYTDYANFTAYVCKAYNGTAPSVCNETTFQLTANAESDQTPQACLRKRATIASVPRPPPITSHMSSGRRQMKMAISEYADLIVNSFSKIFKNGLIDIVDLKLVPYGNTRLGSDGSMTCLLQKPSRLGKTPLLVVKAVTELPCSLHCHLAHNCLDPLVKWHLLFVPEAAGTWLIMLSPMI